MNKKKQSLKKTDKVIKNLEKIEKKGKRDIKKIRYWCQDETRLGLKTIEKRRITDRGVKPIGKVQWQFSAYYLYGVIAPQNGDSFF